ncbi:Erg28p [Rhodotorula paludigena]|uniref:Erg28p n=1 Tax=Rhodotorula paludigena TaxID=86838 RepID=UPI003178F813
MDKQAILDMLPQAPGYLPYWMLFVSSVAVFNSAQNYLTTSLTRKVYARSPASVNPLQARLFGVWTLMSAFVRLYASYHVTSKPMYDLALISYVIALWHFGSEAVLYRTCGLKGLAGPLIVSTTSLTWMISQYDFYVRA